MSHLVLLGDSIFDNGSYVPGQPPVIEQLKGSLPADWSASLLAVDGDVVADVARQLKRLPKDATHLAISAGGNDALGASYILSQPARSAMEVLAGLSTIQDEFREKYRGMLKTALSHRLPTIVCTIYDAIPGLEREAVCALGLFNEVILREAILAGLPVLDLRVLCDQASDYSARSPIEPSALGGAKIAASLAQIATTHRFAERHTIIYGMR